MLRRGSGNVRDLLKALERTTIEANKRSYFTAVLEQTHGKLYASDSACADLLSLAIPAHTG